MVTAIVVHDREERNAMVRGRPKNAGPVHKVAVILDIDAEAAVLAIG
jgi:hypothetical protein